MHLTLREHIAATPQRVYDVFTDLDGADAWMNNLVRIETLTPGPFAVGTRWREVRRMFGREAAEEFEVTGLEPGRSVELYVDGAKGSSRKGYYRFRWVAEPAQEGTALRVECELGGMGRVMALLGRPMLYFFRRALAKDLRAMKAYAERAPR